MAGTLPPAHLVPFHKGWEWHEGVPFSVAQHPSPPSAVGQDRGRRGQRARALGDGLTSCGRAQCGDAAWPVGQQCTWSCMVPLAQHFLQAHALLGLGSCISLAAAALVWPMCLLHQPSMPAPRATPAGCLHSCPVPGTAGGCTGRVTGLALLHVLSTLPAHILGSALPASCQAHRNPWQLRQEMAASTTGWGCVPRQCHPHQGAGTELSPAPRWQGAGLSLLHRPASAPGSTVTSLCFF